MEKKNDWNPELYLSFRNERTQPAIDLVSRINMKNPGRIIDVGCGPGNSTQILREKWGDSEITGIDNSPAMIERAAKDYPGGKWEIADMSEIKASEKYDVVFSNAAIQWVPDQKKLISKLMSMLNKNGILAVQVPMYDDMPIRKIIEEIAGSEKWKLPVNEIKKIITFRPSSFYYESLADKAAKVEMWETSYIHVMDSHKAIVEMVKPTGMKPYLQNIDNDADKAEFENEVIERVKKTYLEQADGKVLFPFKRMFFIARGKN